MFGCFVSKKALTIVISFGGHMRLVINPSMYAKVQSWQLKITVV